MRKFVAGLVGLCGIASIAWGALITGAGVMGFMVGIGFIAGGLVFLALGMMLEALAEIAVAVNPGGAQATSSPWRHPVDRGVLETE